MPTKINMYVGPPLDQDVSVHPPTRGGIPIPPPAGWAWGATNSASCACYLNGSFIIKVRQDVGDGGAGMGGVLACVGDMYVGSGWRAALAV